jgi:hypothetical protein
MEQWPDRLAMIEAIKQEHEGGDRTPLARVAKDLGKMLYGKR